MHFVPAVSLCLILQTYQSDEKDEKDRCGCGGSFRETPWSSAIIIKNVTMQRMKLKMCLKFKLVFCSI